MQNDFIIALAWPEGMVTRAGAWYDFLFAKNGKYRVGHSALVLVQRKQVNFVILILEGIIPRKTMAGLEILIPIEMLLLKLRLILKTIILLI